MTEFPDIQLPSTLSHRMSELLAESQSSQPHLTPNDLDLSIESEHFFLKYGKGHSHFSKIWFETMKSFLNRKKGDWGVLFQLGVRDLENYWRDSNTQEIFEISQVHLDYESAWQACMANKMAICLAELEPDKNFQASSYPDQVYSWKVFFELLNSRLKPYLELEFISFERREVLQEEDHGVKADRVVFNISWLTQGMTWTETAKKRWIKNFFSSLEGHGLDMGRSSVKWVAEGGQFP